MVNIYVSFTVITICLAKLDTVENNTANIPIWDINNLIILTYDLYNGSINKKKNQFFYNNIYK